MEESKLESYISKAENANIHYSKAHHFSNFVEDILGEKVEIKPAKEIFPELENYLVNEKGTLAVRSKTGTPSENLTIELKTSKLEPWEDKEIIENAKN